MNVWIVVPCYREAQLGWAVENFARQTYPHKKLCIVENGDAIGGCVRHGIKPDLVVSSRIAQVGIVRNVGVHAIRELHDDSWIAMCDDDDWYGPAYLEELIGLAKQKKADIYGKLRNFVAFPSCGLHLFNELNSNSFVPCVHGPSLFFRPEGAVEFRAQNEAEEYQWCMDMAKRGAKIWAASVHHLLYLRYASAHDHAWQSNDMTIAMASAANDRVYWFGPVDLGVVTGKVDWRSRVRRSQVRLVSPSPVTPAGTPPHSRC